MEKKIALVTGASSGIGKEMAKVLLEKGYVVYGIGRNFSEETLQYLSGDFYDWKMDLTKTGMVADQIKQWVKKMERVDILVNAAGVGYYGLHEEISPAAIHEMVCLNVEIPMVISGLLLRKLKKSRGNIINVSSVTATKNNNTHGCAYGATKAALSSFSSSLFEEARRYGIKVTTVQPDITKTNFYRHADFCEAAEEEAYLYPEEVASVLDFILSARDGMVLSEITMRPQIHRLGR